MAYQRAPGQKQVLLMMDEAFLSSIEEGMRIAGYSDRSKFIRDAVFEKLRAAGIDCDYKLAMAPKRSGKLRLRDNTVSAVNTVSGTGAIGSSSGHVTQTFSTAASSSHAAGARRGRAAKGKAKPKQKNK